jgi:hypothetical protein
VARRVVRLLKCCAALGAFSTAAATTCQAYPGMGKLPLSPVPYAVPTPQYPHWMEIKPVTPPMPIIPGVIFRPPSEILGNYNDALHSAQALEADAAATAGTAISRSRPVSMEHFAPARDTPLPVEPPPPRRQALGW